MTDERKHPDDSLSEEASAFGERAKGAAKDAVGSMTGNKRMEREGEAENLEGRARQANNDVFEESDGVPKASVTDRTASSLRGFESGTLRDDGAALKDRAVGATKDAAGAALGNRRLEREGELQNAQGRAREAGDVLIGTEHPRGTWHREHLVTGMYDSPEAAGRAYHDLTTRHGYKSGDVSVLMSDETRRKHFGHVKPGAEFKQGTKAAEGAGIGGGIGLGVGAALGAFVAAASSIALPGLGLVVAGPIAGAIAGAGAGGATGTIVGALVGAGIPEERAVQYDRGIREGGIVVGTRARDEKHAAELEKDFAGYGARNILL
jgi:uncharacterized protein YjbJ (UPF0337 family)